MNSNNLPSIKNNDNLTQHFLYSYQHINKVGPTESMREIFADDLIFDRSRKSIFTQGQEFGYIADVYKCIDMGSYTDYTNSYLDFFAYEGVINTYEFIPPHAYNLTLVDNSENKISYIQLNQTININDFKISVGECSSKRKIFDINDADEPIKEIDVKYENVKFAYVVNSTFRDVASKNINSNVVPINNLKQNFFTFKQICLNEPGFATFYYKFRYNVGNDIQISQTLPIGNYITVSNIHNTLGGSRDFLIAQLCLTGIYTEYLNITQLDSQFESITNPITIQQASNSDYILVAIPRRLTDSDVIYCELNNGSTNEMIKITDPINGNRQRKLTYNNAYSKEDYNFYLSLGRCWNGYKITNISY